MTEVIFMKTLRTHKYWKLRKQIKKSLDIAHKYGLKDATGTF